MDVHDVLVDYVTDHDFGAAPYTAHVRVAADTWTEATLVAAQMVAAVGFYPTATY